MSDDFYGLRTRAIENEHLRVEFLRDAGPRIVRLFRRGSNENWFAEAPQRKIPTPSGDYLVRGGHRLWYAPESILRTYQLDNASVAIEELNDGVCLHQPVESLTGIRKSIEIHLRADRVALTHRIENAGAQPIELAPWAITMLKLGGVVILPQPVGAVDQDELLPNRHLVFWSYTRVKDSRLDLDDKFVRVHTHAELPPCKIGYLNRAGWVAYWRDGLLFVKRFAPRVDQPHVDSNCNAEVYCNDEYVELETLAPLVQLEPGQAATHDETWEFYSCPTPESLPNELME